MWHASGLFEGPGKTPALQASNMRIYHDLELTEHGTVCACEQRMTRNEPSLRVLVVDDEPLIRWAVAETLTQAGHEVLEAPDGGSALRALRDATEHVDVVLLDFRLPDCADLTLLSRIRKQSPDSAVVMMSAHATPEIAAEARALGVFDVLVKPFDVNGCERVLRQAHVASRH